MNALLSLSGVSRRFGNISALADVQLQVLPGERIALVGANGSGKSTLLRVLHGLLAPSAGDLERATLLRCAMLFQRPHMLRLSVLANVALGLWLQGSVWVQAKAQAHVALQRVGLDELAARNARTLSGGQQQRLALARAWACQPQLLLLDEPTASLDPHAKREVEALIAQWTQAQPAAAEASAPGAWAAPRDLGDARASQAMCEPASPVTLVFASHNLGQVKRLAQRVIYLERGRVLADLPVHDFFDAEGLQRSHPEAYVFLQGELT